MDTRICIVSFSLAGLISIGGAAAGQHLDHLAGAVPTPSAEQVAQCRQVQPVITGLLDAGLKRLEEARLTNSAAAMRDAADDVQAALVDARTQLAPCAEMQMATTDVVAGHTMPAAPSTAGAAAPESHAAHVVPSATPQPTDAHAAHVTGAKPAPARPVAATHAGHAAVTPKPSEPANTLAEHVDADTPPSTDSSLTELTTPDNPAARLADLMCRSRVDPDRAPRATYLGKAYYFCTAADRDAFLKAPAKFLQP